MISQTIALFRYQLLGILNARMLLLVAFIYLAVFLAGRFAAELAIINSDVIALGLMADLLRYSLVLVLSISTCYLISQDYELSQFERLLTLPISRLQYVLAQNLVLVVFTGMLTLPGLLLIWLLGDARAAGYWFLSVSLELVLVAQFALLAALSLEKLHIAVVFTLAVYLFARVAPVLDLIFTQSSAYYQQESDFQFTQSLFNLIQYLMPDATAFFQNNLIFDTQSAPGWLGRQLFSVIIYGLFIQFVILVDFYRKEFNQA